MTYLVPKNTIYGVRVKIIKIRNKLNFLKFLAHGWPSFRDEEVVWENVRVLDDSEAVSTAGTHLGHNIPDDKGNRFCINLSSVAGTPQE